MRISFTCRWCWKHWGSDRLLSTGFDVQLHLVSSLSWYHKLPAKPTFGYLSCFAAVTQSASSLSRIILSTWRQYTQLGGKRLPSLHRQKLLFSEQLMRVRIEEKTSRMGYMLLTWLIFSCFGRSASHCDNSVVQWGGETSVGWSEPWILARLVLHVVVPLPLEHSCYCLL